MSLLPRYGDPIRVAWNAVNPGVRFPQTLWYNGERRTRAAARAAHEAAMKKRRNS